MHLIAVRHGESTWNAEARWQGQADPELSELGRRQARAVGARLAVTKVDAVVSSDLTRAAETARAVAEPHGLDVVLRPDLRERDVGEWTGLTRSEIVERHPDQWAAYRRHLDPPLGGGETTRDLHARIGAALDAILDEDPGAGSDAVVVVVGHGGTVRAIAYSALGLTPEPGRPMALLAPGNTAIAEIGYDSRGLRLRSYNDTAHLYGVGATETALDA